MFCAGRLFSVEKGLSGNNRAMLPAVSAIALVCLLCSGVSAAPLPEFDAVYSVEKSGMSARMVMTLRRDGIMWRFATRSEPRGLLSLFDAAYVRESSVLEQRAAGLRPVSYEYQAKKKPSERDVMSDFDWESGTLKSKRGSKPRDAELKSGTFDRLSVLLEIIAQLRTGAATMEIPVASRGRIRTRRYVNEEEEQIDVGERSFRTVRVRELRGKGKRHIVSWFAPTEHYLPVRMDQYRKDQHVVRVELVEVRWAGEDRQSAD